MQPPSGFLGRDHYAPRSFFFARKARNASGLLEEIFPPGCAMLQAIFARSIKTRKVMDQCIPSASECRRFRHFRVRSFDVHQGDHCPRGIRTRWAHPVRHRSTAVDSRRPAHAGPQRLMWTTWPLSALVGLHCSNYLIDWIALVARQTKPLPPSHRRRYEFNNKMGTRIKRPPKRYIRTCVR